MGFDKFLQHSDSKTLLNQNTEIIFWPVKNGEIFFSNMKELSLKFKNDDKKRQLYLTKIV